MADSGYNWADSFSFMKESAADWENENLVDDAVVTGDAVSMDILAAMEISITFKEENIGAIDDLVTIFILGDIDGTNYEAREQNYDARINSIANLTFKEIGECGKHHNIHCDVDYHYQCQTGVWPAEDPNLIDSILKGYLWRWLNVYKTLAGETDVLRKIRKRAVEIIKL